MRNEMKSSGLGYKAVAFGVVCLICIVLLYQFNGSKNRIIELEHEGTQCRVKKESLAAQLQVVYEHKSRVEKTLQKEKDGNINAREKFESDLKYLQENNGKEKQELLDKLKSVDQQFKDLRQQHSLLQQQMNQLKDEKLKSDMKCDEITEKSKQELQNTAAQNAQLAKEVERLKSGNAESGSAVDQLKLQVAQLEANLSLCRLSSAKVVHHEAPSQRVEVVATTVASGLQKVLLQVQKAAAVAVTEPPAIPPFHQAPFPAVANLSSSHAAGQLPSLSVLRDITRPTSQQNGSFKEPAAVGQIPLPKDEQEILAAQAALPDTGRKEEVVQAQQVPVPRNPAAILAEEAGAVVPRSAEKTSVKQLPSQPPVVPPVIGQQVSNAKEEHSLQADAKNDLASKNNVNEDVQSVVAKPESNAAKEKLDETDLNNAAEHEEEHYRNL